MLLLEGGTTSEVEELPMAMTEDCPEEVVIEVVKPEDVMLEDVMVEDEVKEDVPEEDVEVEDVCEGEDEEVLLEDVCEEVTEDDFDEAVLFVELVVKLTTKRGLASVVSKSDLRSPR